MTKMDNFDLVSSLQALPETDPIEVDGIQFNPTCGSQCRDIASIIVVNTVCALSSTCN
jgi:hypothetical protein